MAIKFLSSSASLDTKKITTMLCATIDDPAFQFHMPGVDRTGWTPLVGIEPNLQDQVRLSGRFALDACLLRYLFLPMTQRPHGFYTVIEECIFSTPVLARLLLMSTPVPWAAATDAFLGQIGMVMLDAGIKVLYGWFESCVGPLVQKAMASYDQCDIKDLGRLFIEQSDSPDTFSSLDDATFNFAQITPKEVPTLSRASLEPPSCLSFSKMSNHPYHSCPKELCISDPETPHPVVEHDLVLLEPSFNTATTIAPSHANLRIYKTRGRSESRSASSTRRYNRRSSMSAPEYAHQIQQLLPSRSHSFHRGDLRRFALYNETILSMRASPSSVEYALLSVVSSARSRSNSTPT